MGSKVRIDRVAVLEDMAQKGWTQRELARRAKLTEMQVSRLINGITSSQRVAAACAKALRQPVSRYVSVAPPPSLRIA